MIDAESNDRQLPTLHGRVALVTGASGSIGSAVARRLARDGASVVAHYHRDRAGALAVVEAVIGAGGEAVAVSSDLAQRDGPQTLIDRLDGCFEGRFARKLDILVNNAGMLVLNPLTDTTDDEFDRMIAVNVRAPFVLAREAARRMIPNRWGRIIMMGSVFGEAAPFPNISIYGATKFAVRGLARGWSRELGGDGITVNTIQPALIQDPIPTEGPMLEVMKRFSSVGRFGKPEEIADAVSFLVSHRAGFITGSTITIDGGWNA